MKKEKILFEKGYRICEDGKLFNPNGIELKGYIGNNGYLRLTHRFNGKCKPVHFHRIQAYQKFKDKIYEEGIVVRHLNGDPMNNSFDNILIGTGVENALDIPREVRVNRSIKAASYLRKYDKRTVRDFYHSNGKSYKKTMNEFNISSKGTLHFILNK